MMKTNTPSHAQSELAILAKTQPDHIINEFAPQIIALCNAFSKSKNVDGGTYSLIADQIARTFRSLALIETISPLTGDQTEFVEVTRGVFQNNRNPNVFKEDDCRPYYLNAIVFVNINNADDCFCGEVDGIYSRQYIKKFPFTPKTFHIGVQSIPYDPEKHKNLDYTDCGELGNLVFFIADETELTEVFDYYDRYTK